MTLGLTALALRVFGYGSMDLVVFSLAICALAILISCLFCTVLSGIFVQRRVQKTIQNSLSQSATMASLDLEAGFPNETGFNLPSMSLLPLVKLSWSIEFPDSLTTRIRNSEPGQLTEEIIPQKRCKTDHIERLFSVSDVLGFCRYSWTQRQEVNCRVLPRTNTVKPLPLLQSLTAEDGIPNPSGNPDGDRMEIRPYVPGDSVRNIMWKVYARNRQLNVRLAEKSVFHSKRTVAYLLSSQNDEAAAAVARIALQSSAFGEDWAFSADGTETPCETTESALDAIAASRSMGLPFAYGLDQFIELATGQSGAHCIVFAAAENAAWLPALKNTIARYSGQVSIVLATDGMEGEVPIKYWQRLFLQNEQAPSAREGKSVPRSELLQLLTELGQRVESTLIVDRKTGFSFDQNLRKV